MKIIRGGIKMNNHYNKAKLIFIIIIILIVLSPLSAGAKEFFSNSKYLISAVELQKKLDNGSEKIKIIDVRSSTKYLLGHLPNAVHMWGNELTTSQGWVPELIPKAAEFENIAQEKGFNNDSQIIIYGEKQSPWPARLWFIFKLYNHQNVKLLQGDYQAWKSKNYESKIFPYNPDQGNFKVRDVNNKWLINSDTIAENLKNKNFIILDTRSKSEYLGQETNFAAPRQGRIPNSIHLEWSTLLDKEGNYKPTAEIINHFQQLGITKDKETIALISNNGVRAAHTFFTLKLLGYKNIKLYDEGWIGWSNRSDLPIEMD